MAWRIVPLLVIFLLPSGFAQEKVSPKATGITDGDRAKSVGRGLKWLLKAQNRDGSWGLDEGREGCISCTVVAALAIMANGNTERGGPDTDGVHAIRKGLEFVLRHARRMKGDIWKGEATLVQHKLGKSIHSIFATVFLTQVYGQRSGGVSSDGHQELRDAISQLSQIIVKSQEPDGSWHKETFGSLKATCMAWLALRSAASAGVDVEDASVRKTLQFLKAQWNPSSKLFDKTFGNGNYQTIYATASCLRVFYAMGDAASQEAKGATEAFMKLVQTGQMGGAFLTVEGEDYLSAALFTQALLIEQDRRWNEWYPWITGELIKRQNQDGSWTTTACISGRTFATSCAVLTFLAPNRMLPILEQ
jgi:prenyltransferase/squalene oxidase-like repeat protein